MAGEITSRPAAGSSGAAPCPDQQRAAAAGHKRQVQLQQPDSPSVATRQPHLTSGSAWKRPRTHGGNARPAASADYFWLHSAGAADTSEQQESVMNSEDDACNEISSRAADAFAFSSRVPVPRFPPLPASPSANMQSSAFGATTAGLGYYTSTLDTSYAAGASADDDQDDDEVCNKPSSSVHVLPPAGAHKSARRLSNPEQPSSSADEPDDHRAWLLSYVPGSYLGRGEEE